MQCNPSTVDQSTSTSTRLPLMTEEELSSDRSIRILYPSNKLKNSSDQQSRHDRHEQTILLTSTCLDEDQMVCIFIDIAIFIHLFVHSSESCERLLLEI